MQKNENNLAFPPRILILKEIRELLSKNKVLLSPKCPGGKGEGRAAVRQEGFLGPVRVSRPHEGVTRGRSADQ